MTINFTATEADKTEAPQDLLWVAERQLERAVIRLQHVIEEVEAGRFDQLAEAKRVTDNLTSFIRLYMDERNKVDKLRKSLAGAVGASELDFSAARDEIGRRLALLRDAGSH
jgi:HAMP domain-containing protein